MAEARVTVRVRMFDRPLEVTPREAAAMRHQGLLADDAPAAPATPPAATAADAVLAPDNFPPATSSTPSPIQEGPFP